MFLLFILFVSMCAPVMCMESYKTRKHMVPQGTIFIKTKFCDNCCKAETLERFKSCSICHNVRYCSVDCQKQDWTTRHKQQCKKAFDREKRNSEIEKLRTPLDLKIADRIANEGIRPTMADCMAVSDKLEEFGHFYRNFLVETMKGALIKKDDTEFKTHAVLFFATCLETHLQTFPNPELDPILFEFQKLTLFPDIFLSRILKATGPVDEEQRKKELARRVTVYRKEYEALQSQRNVGEGSINKHLTALAKTLESLEKGEATYLSMRERTDALVKFLKCFEGTRAHSKKLSTLGYPEDAVKALQTLRRRCIQTIVEVFRGSKRALPVEEMLTIWAYKLFVTTPCLNTNKVEQLVSCLNQKIVNEQCIIELFDCIKLHSIENDTRLAKLEPVGVSASRNELSKNGKQKRIDATRIRSLGQLLSTGTATDKIHFIAAEECVLLSII